MTAPRSLHLRLVLGAAALIVIALTLVGLFIVQSFSHYIERERLSDLERGLQRIVAEIDVDSPSPLPATLLADPAYDTPLSGVYWQVEDLMRGETIRSRSLWDFELPRAKPGITNDPRVEVVDGPNDQTLIVLSRVIQVEGAEGRRNFGLSIAESRDNPAAAGEGFASEITIALAFVAIILVVAGWFLIWFGLRPLNRLTRDIERIRGGRTTRLETDHPVEVQPLVVAVNELLAGQRAALESARHRAADLAHGLKTPLAVHSATAERLRAGGDRSSADIIDLLGDEMNERVDYQLKLARLRIRTGTQGVATSLNTAILRSVSVLRKTERGEQLNWRVDLERDIEVNVDEHDLMELVGVILENAAKWASSAVDVRCEVRDGMATFDVDDDGNGLTDEQIAQLGIRGTRLDQSRPGDGIGLAIAFEVARLNGGEIRLQRSEIGGIRAQVRLPVAEPAAAVPPLREAAVTK